MNLGKSLSIYTISSLLNASIPFLLLPILTAYLTTEEYGLLSIIQIFIIFTLPFISINISSKLQIEYHHLDQSEFAILVNSVLIIPIMTILLIMTIFILLESYINNFLNISLAWILLIPLISFMQVLPQVVLTIYQISEQPIRYAKFQILLTLLNFIITIILVVIINLKWEGRILAILLSYSIFTMIGIYLLFKMKYIVFQIKKQYIKEAFKLGLPLIIHVISATLFIMSDRLFIAYYLGSSEVGIYAIGVQVGMIAMIVQQSFNQAWVPYLFKNLKTNLYENKVKIIKISYLAFGLFLILPFIIKLLSYPIFDYLIDEKFSESIQYVFWVALGYSFLGMYKVVTNYIFYKKRTKLLARLTLFSLIVNLILNYIFIHNFGAIGVAYATAITMFLFFILTFILSQKICPMPWLYFKDKNVI